MHRDVGGPRRAHRAAPRGAGFALVEVLLSALLLAFGAAALGAALRAAWAAAAEAAQDTQAIARLADLAESLRAVPSLARPAVVAAWRQQIQMQPGAQGQGDAVEDPGLPVWRVTLAWSTRRAEPLHLAQPVGILP